MSRGAGKLRQGEKLSGVNKVPRIPVKLVADDTYLRKPPWLKIRLRNAPEVARIKNILRKNTLVTVCEEASCPNLNECFGGGTATFMIMGDICTRRCPFCDVGHGIPNPLDISEPDHLAGAIAEMDLQYVVITSVDRDDLSDGGAQHFANCIQAVRQQSPEIKIEILVPDFRNRDKSALAVLSATQPDVFNHNLETVPRLYRQARPGARYDWSLKLLREYKSMNPSVPSKSGLMVGLGESRDELLATLDDLREHSVEMLTIGQYLQPSRYHLPVHRYVHPDEFEEYEEYACKIGFNQVASGPLVRSSYHADRQARGEAIT